MAHLSTALIGAENASLKPDRVASTRNSSSSSSSSSATEIAVPNSPKPTLSRSPHPYRRWSLKLPRDESNMLEVVYDLQGSSDGHQTPSTGSGTSDWTRRHTPKSSSNSDSGTEADDESTGFLRGLPAPPARPRKGLRGGRGGSATEADIATPATTPNWLHTEGKRFSFLSPMIRGGGGGGGGRGPTVEGRVADAETRKIREKYTRRKEAEIVRRTAEVALLMGVGVISCSGDGVFPLLWVWRRELLTQTLLVTAVYSLYPCTILFFKKSRLHIPSAFDPAPLLYPVFVPLFVAFSLLSNNQSYLLPNILLGLASIPSQIFQLYTTSGTNTLHWIVTIIPLLISDYSFSDLYPAVPLKLKLKPSQLLDSEILLLLYPLHQSLIPTIEFLTTTSLLPAESHLLSTALINLYLFASAPQAQILKCLLWVGGVLLLVTCKDVLRWEVALARVPSWRFRGGRKHKASGKPFLRILDRSHLRRFKRWTLQESSETDSDSDTPVDKLLSKPHRGRKSGPPKVMTNNLPESQIAEEPASAVEYLERSQTLQADGPEEDFQRGHKRRNTFPALYDQPAAQRPRTTPSGRPKRAMSSSMRSYLSLTAAQAQLRKWIYATYTYGVVALIILGPVRRYVGEYALHGYEPFGWALGYLFGNIQSVRLWIVTSNLERWARLPPWREEEVMQACHLGWLEHIRIDVFGEANTRLMLFAYYAAIVAFGLIVVLRLSSIVEVDTRRKVFHGMMVVMFLPTIYIDPAFVALALALVLAVFLLLDLFRASQLPPISKPLTYFLAPYVDGRDHRGPVIVSHIFLLIGCAIPLWLSLAGTDRTGRDPWNDWDVTTRDVSMVSGIICVGMGDAAASLIGRRYGRRKWFWGGGKSLEGSAAFTVAVTIGILIAKLWLVLGGWLKLDEVVWRGFILKATVAAAGTSMTETLLTGGNDNVIVPLVLWLLVRGLRI